MLLPEPLRGTKLNLRRSHLHDLMKKGMQSQSRFALLNTERCVGDPILDHADIAGRETQETVRISLRCVKEVAVAALQGMTVG